MREKRVAMRWTLDQLAQISGVSRRMIVSVEKGTVNASIGTLLRLSDALGIGIPALVSPTDPASSTPIPRTSVSPLWEGRNGGEAVLLAGTNPPDVVELWDWALGPGDRHDSEAHARGTREIAHVRDGRIRIEVAGQATTLGLGDSWVFDSDVDHAYIHEDGEPARFTLVVYEPDVRSPDRASP